MSLDQIVFTLATVIGSAGFAAIVVKYMERAKVAAESGKLSAEATVATASATDVIQKASGEVVDMMGAQLKQAFTRLAAVEKANVEKDQRIAELEREIIDLRRHITRLES